MNSISVCLADFAQWTSWKSIEIEESAASALSVLLIYGGTGEIFIFIEQQYVLSSRRENAKTPK